MENVPCFDSLVLYYVVCSVSGNSGYPIVFLPAVCTALLIGLPMLGEFWIPNVFPLAVFTAPLTGFSILEDSGFPMYPPLQYSPLFLWFSSLLVCFLVDSVSGGILPLSVCRSFVSPAPGSVSDGILRLSVCRSLGCFLVGSVSGGILPLSVCRSFVTCVHHPHRCRL